MKSIPFALTLGASVAILSASIESDENKEISQQLGEPIATCIKKTEEVISLQEVLSSQGGIGKSPNVKVFTVETPDGEKTFNIINDKEIFSDPRDGSLTKTSCESKGDVISALKKEYGGGGVSLVTNDVKTCLDPEDNIPTEDFTGEDYISKTFKAQTPDGERLFHKSGENMLDDDSLSSNIIGCETAEKIKQALERIYGESIKINEVI